MGSGRFFKVAASEDGGGLLEVTGDHRRREWRENRRGGRSGESAGLMELVEKINSGVSVRCRGGDGGVEQVEDGLLSPDRVEGGGVVSGRRLSHAAAG